MFAKTYLTSQIMVKKFKGMGIGQFQSEVRDIGCGPRTFFFIGYSFEICGLIGEVLFRASI